MDYFLRRRMINQIVAEANNTPLIIPDSTPVDTITLFPVV